MQPSLDSDLVDPVASIKAASQAAHTNGLLFRCSPSRAITTDHGAQMAPYCDQYHIQAQGLQDRPSEYESYVENMVAKLRAANPDIKVSVQVSTQRPAADGMTLLETMKTDSNENVGSGARCPRTLTSGFSIAFFKIFNQVPLSPNVVWELTIKRNPGAYLSGQSMDPS